MGHSEIQQALILLLVGSLVGLWPTVASAGEQASMPAFSADYQVRYGLLRGKMTLELKQGDPGYVYETSLRPTGLAGWFKRGAIRELTTLMDDGGAIRPIDYINEDTIANPARHTSYRFNHQDNRVTGQYKSQAVDAPMRAGGQNRISLQIAVMLALRSNAEISDYPVFDRGRWKDYRFAVIGDQTVKTRSGTFHTVEVRYASSDGDRSWSMHFAPELSFLPVMLVFHEAGKLKSRAQLTDYSLGNSEVSEP